jgi:hypothetical protein
MQHLLVNCGVFCHEELKYTWLYMILNDVLPYQILKVFSKHHLSFLE